MNKHFFYLILLFCISSCQPITKKMMNIEGVVSSEYNGQIIYLVPRPHPTPETVDSAYIVNGTFSHSGRFRYLRYCYQQAGKCTYTTSTHCGRRRNAAYHHRDE